MNKTKAEQEKVSEPGPEPAAVESAAAAELSPEALAQLRAEAAKAQEHWDRLLRTTADFDNFKKRMTRERQDASKYAYAPLFQKLIPVLDNFDAALAAANSSQTQSVQSLQDGIAMIYQQFRAALQEAGLEEIDATGQAFDHNWHEAVSQQATADAPEGHVLQQLRKGYKLRDRLLRPATVIVARPLDAPPAED
jgi:molecular chaperone GrpE